MLLLLLLLLLLLVMLLLLSSALFEFHMSRLSFARKGCDALA
jgi:hypothetical protein